MGPLLLSKVVMLTILLDATQCKRENVVAKGTTLGPGFVRKEGKRKEPSKYSFL
jgi:hypothetical protein